MADSERISTIFPITSMRTSGQLKNMCACRCSSSPSSAWGRYGQDSVVFKQLYCTEKFKAKSNWKLGEDGKEDVKDEPRSGRSPTSTTPDNIERVRRMLADDRRLSLRMIAEELTISLDSVSNIIHEHFQKRKKNVYAFPTLRRSSNV
ncbi:hypothetical protein AVEN_79282-1 [Araneus ventricosus]|uniref:Uncharacterized protein n=1 Tax=Araneus ventricosus TaxID=182803 RepID=A0A4Y2JQS9_ARAVE|nr:hypothetical protein AVEN_79282-1 [Araneus ventricosus]